MKWYNFVLGIIFLVVSAVYMGLGDTMRGVWYLGLASINFIFYLDFKLSEKMGEIKEKLEKIEKSS